MSTKVNCPHCNAALQLRQAPAPGARVKCPRCGQVFEARPLPVARQQLASPPVPVASSKPDERDRDWDEDEPRPRRKKRRREKEKSNTAMLLIGAGAVVLILVFGVVIFIAFMGPSRSEQSSGGAPPFSEPQAPNQRGRGMNGGQMDEEMLQRMMAQMPNWNPDAAAADTLADEITVADKYAIRLPKDFADKSNGKGGGQHFTWTRTAKANAEGPTLALSFQETQGGNPFLELTQFMNNRQSRPSEASPIRDLQAGAAEQGKINGYLAMRSRFTGTSGTSQKKMKGVMYACHMRDRIVVVTVYAPEDDPEGTALAEAAALTLRRK